MGTIIIVLLICVELIKQLLIRVVGLQLYSRKFNFFTILACVVLFSLSVLAAVNGLETYTTKKADKSKEIKTKYKAVIAAKDADFKATSVAELNIVNEEIDRLQAKEKQRKKDFGKYYMLSSKDQKALEDLTIQKRAYIKNLRSSKSRNQAKTDSILALQKAELQENTATITQAKSVSLLDSITIELLILIFSILSIFFDNQVRKINDQIGGVRQGHDTQNVTLSNVSKNDSEVIHDDTFVDNVIASLAERDDTQNVTFRELENDTQNVSKIKEKVVVFEVEKSEKKWKMMTEKERLNYINSSKKKGLTQSEIAKELGVSRLTVSRLVNKNKRQNQTTS